VAVRAGGCRSWPARVAACDCTRAAVDLPVFDACAPRQRPVWNVLRAAARRTVARSSNPTIPRARGLHCYEKTLTARAITRPTTVSEMIDCSAIVSFAHAAMGMTSVGLKAVLVVSPRIR
jgi:hypothetical protein